MQAFRQRQIPRFSCLVRAIFLLVGVPSLLVAAVGYIALSGGLEFDNNRLTTGTFIDVKDPNADCPYYVVAFTTDDGQRVIFETEDCSGAQVGQSVQVMYDPHYPTLGPTVVHLSDLSRWRVATYAIAGSAFTLLGIWPLRSTSKSVHPSTMT